MSLNDLRVWEFLSLLVMPVMIKNIFMLIIMKFLMIPLEKNEKRKNNMKKTKKIKIKNPEEPKDIVKNWMRTKSTIEFMGIWEKINNPHFKGVEFDAFKNRAGSNAFVLSPQKWIESTQAIGIVSKSGRYGSGTYAHKD